MTRLIERIRAGITPQERDPAEVAAELRALADRLEGGTRSTAALELEDLAERWRRLAEYTRKHPGYASAATAYEHCADALEARMRAQKEER